MGKQPSVIIIARHGARLDSVDNQWHLTSPTPYDPPLSYGGWLQGRSLGARIISLLRPSLDTENKPSTDSPSHETQGDADQTNGLPPTPSRKHRIIVHTSPFLRCLQTAIAVSAGISQHSPPVAQPHPTGDTCLLRVDACLGEWLTPDYYEEITPPPGSDRMVAAAKTELVRRGEDILVDTAGGRSATGYFPGGWGSVSTPVSPETEKSPKMTAMASVQSNRIRAASYDTVTNPRAKGVLTRINTNLSHVHAGYAPPTPGYAICPSDPIPSGYVAHARDACLRVDYQWDSMRNPNWGDGGAYGEEWSTMHGRFRRGLMNMVDWYGDHDPPSECNGASEEAEDEADADTDTVLIIITHGAGCNALIGALTGEPVLVDVGTASLTMAVRKETDAERSQSSDDLSQEYALKLVASADHLRPGANPSDISSLASPKPLSSPSSIPSYRHRITRPSLTKGPFIVGPTTPSNSTPREWSLSRPSTAPRVSSGLWGQDGGADSGDEIVPNFDGPGSASLTSGGQRPREDLTARDIPQRTLSQRGLWGSAPLNKDREAGVKRRWTVTERRV